MEKEWTNEAIYRLPDGRAHCATILDASCLGVGGKAHSYGDTSFLEGIFWNLQKIINFAYELHFRRFLYPRFPINEHYNYLLDFNS